MRISDVKGTKAEIIRTRAEEGRWIVISEIGRWMLRLELPRQEAWWKTEGEINRERTWSVLEVRWRKMIE